MKTRYESFAIAPYNRELKRWWILFQKSDSIDDSAAKDAITQDRRIRCFIWWHNSMTTVKLPPGLGGSLVDSTTESFFAFFIYLKISTNHYKSWFNLLEITKKNEIFAQPIKKVHPTHYIIARRAFVWETSKNDVCLFVCPDFSGKSSVAYSERDINFGFT